SPLLWSRRVLAVGAVLIGVLIWLLYAGGIVGRFPQIVSEMRWPVLVQAAFFAVAGIGILALAAVGLWTHRNAESLLLFLLVAGTWFSATFLNWTINGRSILPMVPAIGILLVRRIERRYGSARFGPPHWLWWPLVPAACLALLTSAADYSLARSAREAAVFIHEHLQNHARVVWFSGHWGFQYYMQQFGCRAFDAETFEAEAGDVLIVPHNKTNAVAI